MLLMMGFGKGANVTTEVACCPAQPHPPPLGLEAAHFPDCTRDQAPLPGVVCCLFPWVVRGRAASSTLPKVARLSALPAGREVGVGRADGGMRAHTRGSCALRWVRWGVAQPAQEADVWGALSTSAGKGV